MMNRKLGPSGLVASALGLGTWAIGGWMWGGVEERDAERAILTSIDAGVNLIDTAPVYGFGRSEEIVGRAIKSRRDEVILATKCGLIWNRTEGQFFFATDERGRNDSGSFRIHRFLGAQSLRQEVESSLRRLRTDRIDLYQTHWQDETRPIADTMALLLRLKQEGKIRAIGVCNASSAQMAQYRAEGQLDSDQEKYSMLDREIETDQLPFCRQQGLAVLAYSPLALGLLSGRIRESRVYGEGDLRRDNPRFTGANLSRVNTMLDDLAPVASDRGLTVAQLVIAWTLAQPGVTHVLVGARNPEQAKENARGMLKLEPDEVALINAVLQRHNLKV